MMKFQKYLMKDRPWGTTAVQAMISGIKVKKRKSGRVKVMLLTRDDSQAIFCAKQHHDIFDNATLCHPYFTLNVRSSSTCRVLTSACESLSLKKRNMLFVDRPFKYKHIHWRRPKTGIASRWYVTS